MPRSAVLSAVVLAGGLGTRLRSVVGDTQKVVSQPDGRPFVLHVLDQLADQGVTRIVVCAGFRAEDVRAVVEGYRGLDVRLSIEPEPRGTGGAIGYARTLLPTDEPVFVLNGDSYCDTDLGALVAVHRAHAAAATLTLTHVPEAARYGTVTTDAAGAVTAFLEKGRTGPAWINAGVYVLGPAVLQSLPADRPCSLERDVFPTLIGHGLHATRGGGRFLDIGVPADHAAAGTFFRPSPLVTSGAPPFVLLDRDGTLNVEVNHLSRPDQVELLPGVPRALRHLRALGCGLVVVTNQSPIGRGWFGEDTLAAIHARLDALLAAEGVTLDGILYCPHAPDAGCACRKPAAGLALTAAARFGFDPARAFVVGDKASDLGMGRAVGATTVLVRTGHGRIESSQLADCVADDLWCAALAIERRLRGA